MKLSIIIPTFNERHYIGRLLDRLISSQNENIEIIVVDGGSSDETVQIVQNYPVRLIETQASRSHQQNLGAEKATHDHLFFVHADTLPPKSFYEDVTDTLAAGFEACCYRTKFEESRLLMKLNEFHTRYHKLYFRGGDQGLGISKKRFEEMGRFNEEMAIMEEYPLLEDLMKRKVLKVIPKDMLISSRKYKHNSWWKVTRANYIAYRMYKKGEDTSEIRDVYRGMLSLD